MVRIAQWFVFILWLQWGPLGLAPGSAHSEEFTPGVESEEDPGLSFQIASSTGIRGRIDAPGVFLSPGSFFILEAGVVFQERLLLLLGWQSQRQVFSLESAPGTLLEWSGSGPLLGGRVYPFPRQSGFHPFFGGGIARTRGTLFVPGRERSWTEPQGYGEGGVEWVVGKGLALWLLLRFESGQKGPGPDLTLQESPGWLSGLNVSRSASWGLGSGVGIYF